MSDTVYDGESPVKKPFSLLRRKIKFEVDDMKKKEVKKAVSKREEYEEEDDGEDVMEELDNRVGRTSAQPIRKQSPTPPQQEEEGEDVSEDLIDQLILAFHNIESKGLELTMEAATIKKQLQKLK